MAFNSFQKLLLDRSFYTEWELYFPELKKSHWTNSGGYGVCSMIFITFFLYSIAYYYRTKSIRCSSRFRLCCGILVFRRFFCFISMILWTCLHFRLFEFARSVCPYSIPVFFKTIEYYCDDHIIQMNKSFRTRHFCNDLSTVLEITISIHKMCYK